MRSGKWEGVACRGTRRGERGIGKVSDSVGRRGSGDEGGTTIAPRGLLFLRFGRLGV